MARLKNENQPFAGPAHRIAVIDDDADLRRSLSRLLQHEGHETKEASTPEEGAALIGRWRPDLVLLDYYLDGGTGADALEMLCDRDPLTQIILVTGYAAEQPGRQLLRELDIQGYHDKSEGAERLLLLVDSALKHHRALRRFARHQGYLERILAATPVISRLQPPRQLLQRALVQLQDVVRGGDGLVATSNPGMFVLDRADEAVSIQAGTGRFSGVSHVRELSPEVAQVVREMLEVEEPQLRAGFLAVPLKTRDDHRGWMLLEAPSMPQDALQACMIYAQHVVQCFENVKLYEQATVDSLTQLFNRAHGEDRLRQALKLASRAGRPTSVVLVDVDHFKHVNDSYGHAAGDLVLRELGHLLQACCRESDVAVRWGGEELLVILPDTDRDGALQVASRICATIERSPMTFEGRDLSVTVSVGVATARTSSRTPSELVAAADAALYEAKSAGRNTVRAAPPASSAPPPLARSHASA